MLAAAGALADKRVPQVLNRGLGGQRYQLRAHDLPHEENLEGINGIFACEVETSTGYLFSQDGAFQQEHGSAVRQHGRHQ